MLRSFLSLGMLRFLAIISSCTCEISWLPLKTKPQPTLFSFSFLHIALPRNLPNSVQLVALSGECGTGKIPLCVGIEQSCVPCCSFSPFQVNLVEERFCGGIVLSYEAVWIAPWFRYSSCGARGWEFNSPLCFLWVESACVPWASCTVPEYPQKKGMVKHVWVFFIWKTFWRVQISWENAIWLQGENMDSLCTQFLSESRMFQDSYQWIQPMLWVNPEYWVDGYNSMDACVALSQNPRPGLNVEKMEGTINCLCLVQSNPKFHITFWHCTSILSCVPEYSTCPSNLCKPFPGVRFLFHVLVKQAISSLDIWWRKLNRTAT